MSQGALPCHSNHHHQLQHTTHNPKTKPNGSLHAASDGAPPRGRVPAPHDSEGPGPPRALRCGLRYGASAGDARGFGSHRCRGPDISAVGSTRRGHGRTLRRTGWRVQLLCPSCCTVSEAVCVGGREIAGHVCSCSSVVVRRGDLGRAGTWPGAASSGCAPAPLHAQLHASALVGGPTAAAVRGAPHAVRWRVP
jgi:hypothetical protein